MDPTLRALNRFGLGARPGEARRIRSPRSWLEAQLDGPPPLLDDPWVPSPEVPGRALGALRAARRAKDRDALAAARRAIRDVGVAEAGALLDRRVASDRPFVERLVAFWSNHLCVSTAGKVAVAPLAGGYERDVVRPHVLGRFEDMVLASARHPAMLLYLDNARSVGPNSPAGRQAARRGRDVGINENYGREVMELHTLGVDGGYTQADVQEVARALTGWTVTGVGPGRGGAAGEAVGFAFRPLLHEPGSRTVLGTRFPGAGEEQGEAVLRALCRHPSTARFVAGKLARHFVADDPPPAAVDALARVFSASGGDLREVSRALVTLEPAWDPAHRKLRTPQDWVVAALRALGARTAPVAFAGALRQLRHPLWAPPAPNGFPDSEAAWADPDALMNRAELARTLGRRVAPGGTYPRGFLEVMDAPAGDPLPGLLADGTLDPAERTALALAGPAFQWR